MNNTFFNVKQLFLFIFLAFSAWALIHLLAIFGVFLSLAIPLWWLFFPNQSVCLLCHAKQAGDFCPLCRRQITKDRISPRNLVSAALNGGLVLIFSLISIGMIFVESQILLSLGFSPMSKTVSFIIPKQKQYRIGEIIPLKIEVVGIKTPINVVQTDLGFEPEQLEVVKVSTAASFAKIFIQKEINNTLGYFRLTGGLPNPGFAKEKGLFATVFFRGKIPGLTEVDFLPSSMVLANDGRGTNVVQRLQKISYLILPEKISAEEEKRQEIFLRSNSLEETTSTAIRLYAENNDDILGTQTKREIQQLKKINVVTIFFDYLAKFNLFVLARWKEIFSFLTRSF